MSKHTPGPWAFVDSYPSVSTLRPSRGISITHVKWATDMSIEDSTIAEANARLIAAAPDLLEAAKEIEKILQFAFEDGALPPKQLYGLCIDPYGVLKDLRAAIAKAEGKDNENE